MTTGSISTLGVGSGLQLQDILDQLRGVDEQVLDRSRDQVAGLELRLEKFSETRSSLLNLSSIGLELSLSSNYLGRTISNTNDAVLGATVTDGAEVLNASVAVERLASRSAWLTTGMASGESVVNDLGENGSFRYEIGGAEVTVTVPAGTTLKGLAELINNQENNGGVTARLIDNGSGGEERYQLLLQARETGSANSIIMHEVPNLLAMNRQEAGPADLNAAIVVDGISYQRQANSISDILPGVTLDLRQVGATFLGVAADSSQINERITKLVESYNEIVQDLKVSTAFDTAREEPGLLAGTTLRDLPHQLQNFMTTKVTAGDGTITSLFDLGLEFNQDGSIRINQEKLAAAISENPQGLQDFFLGDPEADVVGFADQMVTRLRGVTGGGGQIEAERSAAQTRIRDLELQIENSVMRLDRKYQTLAKQFIELDRYMSQMTSMSDFLTSQFESMSKMWNSGNNKK